MPHDGDQVRVNKAKEKPLRWQLQGGYEPVGVLLHALFEHERLDLLRGMWLPNCHTKDMVFPLDQCQVL